MLLIKRLSNRNTKIGMRLRSAAALSSHHTQIFIGAEEKITVTIGRE